MDVAPIDGVTQLPKHLYSRVLYANPVCFLTVHDPSASVRKHRCNVMTISWLTAVNNRGGVFLSMNSKRHTASFLSRGCEYICLSVATKGHEDLLISIGGCTGAEVDKFELLSIPTCRPGCWSECVKSENETCGEGSETLSRKRIKVQKQKSVKQLAKEELERARDAAVAIDGPTAAHVLLKITKVLPEDDGHLSVFATISGAWVRNEYWKSPDGKKVFAPATSNAPPTLSFCGSKVFCEKSRIYNNL